MNITIIGTGYVGLSTGLCLAEIGHNVVCHDIIKDKIEKLKKGECPIYEKDLPELLQKHKGVKYTTDLKEAIKEAEAIFLCLPTPTKEGQTDLSYLEKAIKDIAEIGTEAIIVEKSTVPVKTAKWIKALLKEAGSKAKVAVNPEFLREGTSVEDFMKPDRIVVGVDSQKAKKVMEEIYSPLKAEIIFTNLESAELIKHASNSFLAMKISFANMVAELCEQVGANIETVMKGMGKDKRIGESFLKAGLGYGGGCFPKDLESFTNVLEEHDVDSGLMRSTKEVNERQIDNAIRKVEEAVGNIKEKEIAILGLTFKAGTDDVRGSQAIKLAEELKKKGAKVKAYDPEGMENAKKVLEVEFCENIDDAIENVELVIIATEWEEFKELKDKKVEKILDLRNIFEKEEMEKKGVQYISVGR